MLWSDFIGKLDQLLAGGGSGSTAALPPGYIAAFVDGAIPAGWQKLDGSALAIADNPVLYALFGTRYNTPIDELATRAAAVSLVPAMSSNSAPAGYKASASSVFGTGYEAFRAFDGIKTSTNAWIATSGVFTGWLRIDLPAANWLTGYTITSRADVGADPKNFTLEGSTDGTNWSVLDTRSNITNWTTGSANSFELDASQLAATFSKFRLVVSATATADNYLAVGELTLMGGTPVLLAVPAAGQFRLPRLSAAPADLPGSAWCVKAG